MAEFTVDGVVRFAGIRFGRRKDVAAGTDQLDIQLRVNDMEFDADKFLSEADVADIVEAVSAELEKTGLPAANS